VINNATERIEKTREAIKTAQKYIKSNKIKNSKEVTKSAKKLDSKLKELAETLNPTPQKQGIADRSAGLRSQVMQAVRGMMGAEYEPISQAAKVKYEKVKVKVDNFLIKFNDVFEIDVENFKKLLAESDFS